jgi:hypothetical protein
MLVCRGDNFQLQGLFVKIIVGQEEHLVAILLALPYTQNKTQRKRKKRSVLSASCFVLKWSLALRLTRKHVPLVV